MDTETVELDLDAIEARANEATPGPWHCTYGPREHAKVWTADMDEVEPLATLTGFDNPVEDKGDAEFIAHAREDMPALLTEVRRLREEVAGLRARKRRVAKRSAFRAV